MSNWEKLPLKAKSELMSIYLKNGITSLDEMKKHYNSFAEPKYPPFNNVPQRTDISDNEKRARGKWHVENAKENQQSIITKAFNEAKSKGLTTEQAYEYVADVAKQHGWSKEGSILGERTIQYKASPNITSSDNNVSQRYFISEPISEEEYQRRKALQSIRQSQQTGNPDVIYDSDEKVKRDNPNNPRTPFEPHPITSKEMDVTLRGLKFLQPFDPTGLTGVPDFLNSVASGEGIGINFVGMLPAIGKVKAVENGSRLAKFNNSLLDTGEEVLGNLVGRISPKAGSFINTTTSAVQDITTKPATEIVKQLMQKRGTQAANRFAAGWNLGATTINFGRAGEDIYDFFTEDPLVQGVKEGFQFAEGGSTNDPPTNIKITTPLFSIQGTLPEDSSLEDRYKANDIAKGIEYAGNYFGSEGFKNRAIKANQKYGYNLYNIDDPLSIKYFPKRINFIQNNSSANAAFNFGLSLYENPISVGGHETGHHIPLYNTYTFGLSDDIKTQMANPNSTLYSPRYHNDYSQIPEEWRNILKPINPEDDHNAELSEAYSDLVGLRAVLKDYGIFDSDDPNAVFTQEMLNEFKKQLGNRTNRFLDYHSDENVIRAVNEIADAGQSNIGNYAAKGGKLDIPPYKRYYATPQYGFSPETSDVNTYSLEKDIAKKEAVKKAQKNKVIREAQSKKNAIISEDTDTRSYQQRQIDSQVQNIVNSTLSQQISPGNIDFNTLETGISKGLQVAMLPEVGAQILARPITFLTGTAGNTISNGLIKATTNYDSYGDLIGRGLFKTNNKGISTLLNMTNPVMIAGGLYGNGVENRLAETLIRRGDGLKNGMATAPNLFKHIFPDLPEAIKKNVGKNHPILSYILNPKQRDLIYKINETPPDFPFDPELFLSTPYSYNGTNVGLPYKGDLVDVFFNKGINNTGFDYVRDTPTFFANYMAKNYPHKTPYWFRIGEASVNTPSKLGAKYRNNTTEGIAVFPEGSTKSFVDPGGFRKLEETLEATHFADIWKYNGKDALKRYGRELSYTPVGKTQTLQSKFYKPLIKTFGNFIDAHSTPIITQWYDTRPIYGYADGGSLDIPPFTKRYSEGQRRAIPTSQGPATHYMAVDSYEDKHYVYPTVQPINYNDTNSPLKYYGDRAFERALENNDVMPFNLLEDAIRYSENYKRPPSTGAFLNTEESPLFSPYDYINSFSSGGKIFIKPENRGKFTALKKRTGHSATWFKENGTPAQKKMAVFELNSKKWSKK